MKRVPRSGGRNGKGENTKNAKMPPLLRPNNSERSVCSFATRNTKIFQIKTYFQTVASFCIYAQVHRVIATKIRRKSLPVTQRLTLKISRIYFLFSLLPVFSSGDRFIIQKKKKKRKKENIRSKNRVYSKNSFRIVTECECKTSAHRKGKRFLSNLTSGKRHREKRYIFRLHVSLSTKNKGYG